MHLNHFPRQNSKHIDIRNILKKLLKKSIIVFDNRRNKENAFGFFYKRFEFKKNY